MFIIGLRHPAPLPHHPGRPLRSGRRAQHFNPYTYDDIKTIADHRHYVGGNPHGGNGRSDSAGGGHAHSGLMIYQGGLWPDEYRGSLFMNNIHGHRINVDVLTPKGCGFVGDRNPDFLLANDRWSIPVAIKYGPDGNVYLIDWYDKQTCHTPTPTSGTAPTAASTRSATRRVNRCRRSTWRMRRGTTW